MKSLSAVCLIFLLAAPVYSQTGSINNTLGSGGTFGVKGTASDSLLIVKDNGNVGIGTSSPASPLDVVGQLTADRIKVDGVPSFFATHIDETGLGAGLQVLETWDEVTSQGSHDNSDSFDPTTGIFTAPRSGFYFLSARIEMSGVGGSGALLAFKINFNFTGLQAYIPTSYSASTAVLSVAGVLKLSAGQTVKIEVNPIGSSGSAIAGSGYFSGYLVSDF